MTTTKPIDQAKLEAFILKAEALAPKLKAAKKLKNIPLQADGLSVAVKAYF